MWCPRCAQEYRLRVLPLHSPEADQVCLLCESEGICRKCSRELHGPS